MRAEVTKKSPQSWKLVPHLPEKKISFTCSKNPLGGWWWPPYKFCFLYSQWYISYSECFKSFGLSLVHTTSVYNSGLNKKPVGRPFLVTSLQQKPTEWLVSARPAAIHTARMSAGFYWTCRCQPTFGPCVLGLIYAFTFVLSVALLLVSPKCKFLITSMEINLCIFCWL